MFKKYKVVPVSFIVIALIFGIVAGGIAMAADPPNGNNDGIIRAAYQKAQGMLRILSEGEEPRPSEEYIEWSITGPQGPQGEPGPQGEQGPPGPVAGNNGQFVYNDNGSAAGAQVYYNNSNGNVGIGTSPSQKLDVSGGNIELDGARYIGMSGHDTYSYDGDSVGWYSLGWYDDSWFSYGNTAYLTGYGGIKLFTGGTSAGQPPAISIGYWGDTTIDGKLTVTGGVDPPYVSYSKESHESIREFAQNVGDHEEVMQFWNGETNRMEIYDIEEDKFYTIIGELIEE